MPFIKLQRPREFKIETYYYKPDDEDFDPKRRIRFRRIRRSKRGNAANPVRLLLVILLLIFMIYYLQKKANFGEPSAGPDTIQVEEVIVVD